MTFGMPIRTVPPAVLPVSLAELRAQANLEGIDEGGSSDALLMGYARAATEYHENKTGLGFITQTFTQTFWRFPTTKQPDMLLRRRPLQAVLSVDYLDTGGVSGVLDPSVYRVSGIGADQSFGAIRLASGAAWPSVLDAMDAITVTYRVGFGDDHNAVPELIRQAILLKASTWFDFRSDVVSGTTIAHLDFASDALMSHWQPLSVGV